MFKPLLDVEADLLKSENPAGGEQGFLGQSV
jgi:hypothetical protein